MTYLSQLQTRVSVLLPPWINCERSLCHPQAEQPQSILSRGPGTKMVLQQVLTLKVEEQEMKLTQQNGKEISAAELSHSFSHPGRHVHSALLAAVLSPHPRSQLYLVQSEQQTLTYPSRGCPETWAGALGCSWLTAGAHAACSMPATPSAVVSPVHGLLPWREGWALWRIYLFIMLINDTFFLLDLLGTEWPNNKTDFILLLNSHWCLVQLPCAYMGSRMQALLLSRLQGILSWALTGAARNELLPPLSLHGDCCSAPTLPGHSWGLSHCCEDCSIAQQHFTLSYFKIKNKQRNKQSCQTWGPFFCCLIPAGKTPVNPINSNFPHSCLFHVSETSARGGFARTRTISLGTLSQTPDHCHKVLVTDPEYPNLRHFRFKSILLTTSLQKNLVQLNGTER